MFLRPRLKRLIYLGLIVFAVDIGTYFALCYPEAELRKTDPTGFYHLQEVLRNAGGIWALSPAERCVVHLAFTTGIMLFTFVFIALVSRLLRRRSADTKRRSEYP
jgi:hypothetical protein